MSNSVISSSRVRNQIVLPSLDLTFNSIVNVPVANAGSVSDWNTFFNMSTNALTSFSSVAINGNKVSLYGGTGLNVASSKFANNLNIISVEDDETIGTLGLGVFNGASNLTTAILPVLRNVTGNAPFNNCISLTTLTIPLLSGTTTNFCFGCTSLQNIIAPSLVNVAASSFRNCSSANVITLPVCGSLGGSTINNNVFTGISGRNITLTISTAIATDQDVTALQSINTVNLILV